MKTLAAVAASAVLAILPSAAAAQSGPHGKVWTSGETVYFQSDTKVALANLRPRTCYANVTEYTIRVVNTRANPASIRYVTRIDGVQQFFNGVGYRRIPVGVREAGFITGTFKGKHNFEVDIWSDTGIVEDSAFVGGIAFLQCDKP